MSRDLRMFLGGLISGSLIIGGLLIYRYEKLLTEEAALNEGLMQELNMAEAAIKGKFEKKNGRYPLVDDAVTYKKIAEQYTPVSTDPYDKVEISREEKESHPEDDPSVKLPYVISFQQFCEECNDFEKESATYWAGDDVLCDCNEQPYENYRDVVGEQFVHSFGYSGSDDDTVVYVRNESVECDYEIQLDDRKYGEVVCDFND